MKQSVKILSVIAICLSLQYCSTREQENPIPPSPPAVQQDLSSDDAVISVSYQQIVAEATSTEKRPFSAVPGLFVRQLTKKHIDMSKLPPNVDYKDLDKYSTQSLSGGGSGCEITSTKICGFRCGLKVLYIVTGIPTQCSCYTYADGMDIWCPGDCRSYELSCGDR